MLAFSNDYYGLIFRATQSVELFCTYLLYASGLCTLHDILVIMECRQSGLTDHQWCVEHDIKPGTFYNWVKRLRQKGCVDLPASTRRTYCAPESQEVVRVEFHDTDPIPYEQPLNVIPATTERNNLSVAEPMKLSVGSFHLTIPTLLII